MNQRAFNLFTALVSFVMILLAVILTNSMTQTEDKAISTLGELEQQSEIQAVADLARGDALQVFIYNLRYGMESWITKPDNWFPLESGKKWNEVVDSYIRVNFGGDVDSTGRPRGQQFAFFVTKQLSGVLAVGSSFGRYAIDLKQNDAAMLEALNTTITNSTDQTIHPKGQQFFELLKCDCPTGVDCDSPTADQCQIGTFYVNLDLSRGAFDPANCKGTTSPPFSNCTADDQMYESLPKIIVRRIGTSQTLETRILPRSKIKIYVPIRIFKAVASAKRIADGTVFGSGGLQENLANLKLGMCDQDVCRPREKNVLKSPTDPENENPDPNWNKACPGSYDTWFNGQYNLDTKLITPINIPSISFSADYNPHKPTEMAIVLGTIIDKMVCDNDHGAITLFRQDLGSGGNLEGFEKIECGSSTHGTPADGKTITPGENTNKILGDQGIARCVSANRMTFDLKYFENDPLYMVTKPELTGGTRPPYTIQVSGALGASPALQNCESNCEDPDWPGSCNDASCKRG